MKSVFTFCLLFFVYGLVLAQTTEKEADVPGMVTDRPDQTESSVTVPRKHLQIETGYVFEKDEVQGLDYNNTTLNTTLLRYGLLDNMELRFGFEYMKTKVEGNGFKQEDNGLAPLSVGTKIAITKQEGIIPEMAFLTGLTLPNTGKEVYQSEYLNPVMIMAFTYSLSGSMATGVNLGAEWGDGNGQATGIYSWVLGLGVTDKMGAFIETYGTFKKDTDFDSRIDGGITYAVKSNLQLDLSTGIGLTDVSPDFFIGFGLSYRMPN